MDTSPPGYVHAEEGMAIFPAKACLYIYVPAYCFNSCKMYSIYYYPELNILKKKEECAETSPLFFIVNSYISFRSFAYCMLEFFILNVIMMTNYYKQKRKLYEWRNN